MSAIRRRKVKPAVRADAKMSPGGRVVVIVITGFNTTGSEPAQ